MLLIGMPMQLVNLTVIASIAELRAQGRLDDLQRILRLAATVAALPALLVVGADSAVLRADLDARLRAVLRRCGPCSSHPQRRPDRLRRRGGRRIDADDVRTASKSTGCEHSDVRFAAGCWGLDDPNVGDHRSRDGLGDGRFCAMLAVLPNGTPLGGNLDRYGFNGFVASKRSRGINAASAAIGAIKGSEIAALD